MLDNFVNSLDDGFNTEALFKIKQICILNNNIFSPREREKNLDKKKNFLKN